MEALKIILEFNNMLITKIGISFLTVLQHYLLINIEIFILIIIFDYLLKIIQEKLRTFYDDKKYKLLSTPKKLVRFIRSYYLILKIIISMRPMYSARYKSDRQIYESITKPSIYDSGIDIIMFFLRPSFKNIIALILLLLLYFDFLKYFLDYSWIFALEINREKIESFLGIAVPMFTVLVAIFAWRYTGERGQLIRTLAQANRNHFEKVIDFHRKIKTDISGIIFHAPDNLDYALLNRGNIIKNRIYRLSPFFKIENNNKILWNNIPDLRENIKLTLFNDINEIKNLYDKLIEAQETGIYYSLTWFSRLDYDLRNIYELPIYQDLSDFQRDLNLHFLTKTGYEQLITIPNYIKSKYKDIENSPPEEKDRAKYEKDILEEKVHFEKRLDTLIIKGIEILVKLEIYYKCSFRLLSIESNKIDRLLNYIFDRE